MRRAAFASSPCCTRATPSACSWSGSGDRERARRREAPGRSARWSPRRRAATRRRGSPGSSARPDPSASARRPARSPRARSWAPTASTATAPPTRTSPRAPASSTWSSRSPTTPTRSPRALRLARVGAEAANRARDLQNLPANVVTPTYLADRARELAVEFETVTRRGPRPRRDRRAWPRRPGRRRRRQRAGAEADHAAVLGARIGRGPRPGRQGRDVRQRRDLDQAVAGDARDEDGHVGRRRGARGRRGDRRAGAGAGRRRRDPVDREHAVRHRHPARRHHHPAQRQDGRGQQHRRRGPADPGRRADLVRPRAGRRPGGGPRHAHRRRHRRARLHLRGADLERRRARRRRRGAPRRAPASWPGGCRSTPSTRSSPRARSPTSPTPRPSARPGTIYAGSFLEEFVDGKPWAHLDIAGTAWDTGREYVGKGPTGFGVRLLVGARRGPGRLRRPRSGRRSRRFSIAGSRAAPGGASRGADRRAPGTAIISSILRASTRSPPRRTRPKATRRIARAAARVAEVGDPPPAHRRDRELHDVRQAAGDDQVGAAQVAVLDPDHPAAEADPDRRDLLAEADHDLALELAGELRPAPDARGRAARTCSARSRSRRSARA